MTDINAALAPIRERFRSRCAEDAASLRSALAQEEDALARSLSHRLAGLAGTIGFPDISNAAADLEEAIDAALPRARVAEEAAALLALLDRAASDQPR